MIENLMKCIAEKFDCVCKMESDGTTVLLETFSPEGQDVVFESDLRDFLHEDMAEAYARELREYADSYDPDEEAALWIGPDGHGKAGAPYRLRDLLDDMEWAKKFFEQVAAYATFAVD